MLEQGKFYNFIRGDYKEPSDGLCFECLYGDYNLAVLRVKGTLQSTFAVNSNAFSSYKEHIPKLNGSGHLVVLSYSSFDGERKMLKIFLDEVDDPISYTHKMGQLDYKTISVTPVSWEENQS